MAEECRKKRHHKWAITSRGLLEGEVRRAGEGVRRNEKCAVAFDDSIDDFKAISKRSSSLLDSHRGDRHYFSDFIADRQHDCCSRWHFHQPIIRHLYGGHWNALCSFRGFNDPEEQESEALIDV